ncbi:hypothetical protein [Afifella sp. IM 167]|uniref:hypothetical protein n=1 Tax=Afifella sp. IM 167 TaxID=2033586 RepID=UPI001CCF876E|nr:hypothetical protein [Afifella sp. IM 167]MBZ8134566.1 hypothetical protein [Afifella sp. IM 167]
MNRRSFLVALGALAGFGPSLPAVAAGEPLRMRDLYNKDLSFSDLAHELEGQRITIKGFMAPPLKAESRFFVLTKRPMAVCPFCESEADWPDDIIAVYTRRIIDVEPYNVALLSSGILKLGSFKDEDTGFVSQVRIVESHYERA